jgi:hypothetical protein
LLLHHQHILKPNLIEDELVVRLELRGQSGANIHRDEVALQHGGIMIYEWVEFLALQVEIGLGDGFDILWGDGGSCF